MKEIKRYSKPHKVWIPSKLGQWCQTEDVAELEAVVETMQKRIDELEAEKNMLKNCGNCNRNKETSQYNHRGDFWEINKV